MNRRKTTVSMRLTQRAIADLLEIEEYSVEKWGKGAAEKYLEEVNSSLEMIKLNPGILCSIQGMPKQLQVYRVKKHHLFCDVRANSIVVLSVLHTSMDVVGLLSELCPTLADEVKLLHGTTKSRTKK